MYSYTKPSYLDSYQQRSNNKHSSRTPFPDVHNNSYTASYHQAAGDLRQQMKVQEIMQKHSRDQQRLLQLMNENSYLRKNRQEKIQRHSEKTKAEADYILSLRRDNKRVAYLKYLHGQNDHQIVENLYAHPPEKPRSRLSSMDQRHYRIPGSPPQHDSRDMHYRDSQYYTEGSPRTNGVKMYRIVKGVRVYETNLMQYEASRPSYNKDYSWDPARAHTSPLEEEEDEDDIAIKMWIDGTQPYYTQEDEGLNYQSPTSESMRRDEYMSHHGSQRSSMRGSGRAYGRDLPSIGSRKGSYGGKDSMMLDQYMDPRMQANAAKWNSNQHRNDDQDYILDEDVRGNRNYQYPSPPHKPMRKPSLNVSFDNRNRGNHGNSRPRAGSHERGQNISFDSESAMRDRNHFLSSQHSSGKRSHGPNTGSRNEHYDPVVLDPVNKHNNQRSRVPVKVPREKSPSHLNVPQLTHNLSFGAPKDGDSDPFEASEYGHEDLRAPPQQQMRPKQNSSMIYSHMNKKPAEPRNPQSQPQRKPNRNVEPLQNTQNRTNNGRGRSISGPTPGPKGLEQKSLGPRKVSQNSGDLLKQLQESKDGFVSIQLDQFRDLDQNPVSPKFINEVLAGDSKGSQMNNSQIPKVVVYDTDTKRTVNMEFLKPVKPMGKNRSSSVNDGRSRVKGSAGNSPLVMKPIDKILLGIEPNKSEEVNNEAVAVKEESRREVVVIEKVVQEKKQEQVEEESEEIKEKEVEERHEEIKEKKSEKIVEKVEEDKIAAKEVEIIQAAAVKKEEVEEKIIKSVKEEKVKDENNFLEEEEKSVRKIIEKSEEKVERKSPEKVKEGESERVTVEESEEETIEKTEEKVEEKPSEKVTEKKIIEKSIEKTVERTEEKVEEKVSEKAKEETTREKESEDIQAEKQEESVVEEISEKKQEIEAEEVCEEILNDNFEEEEEEEIASVQEEINQESVTQEILEEIKSELATKIKHEKSQEETKELLLPSKNSVSVKRKASEKSIPGKISQPASQKNPEKPSLPKEAPQKITEPESMKSIEDGNQSNLSVTSLNLMDKVQSPLKAEPSSRRSPQIPKLQSLDKIQVASTTQAKAKAKQPSQQAKAHDSSRKDLLNQLNNLSNEYPQANPSDKKKPMKPSESTKKIQDKEVSKETSPLVVSGSPLSFAPKVEETDENIFDYLEDVDNAANGLKSSLSESLSRQTLRVPILEEGGDHNDAQSDSTIQGLLGLDIEKKQK